MLLYILFKVLSDEQLALIKTISTQKYVISAFFILLYNTFAGLQLRNVYSQINVVKLSWYDTLTLPMVMNFWGYVIPVQGSFVYSAFYLKKKYNTSVSSMAGVYLSIMSISLSLGGLFGIVFYLSNHSTNILFLSLTTIFLFNPLLIILSSLMLSKSKIINHLLGKYSKILLDFTKPIIYYFKQPKLIVQTVILDAAAVVVFSIWSYWISETYDLQIPFLALLITAFLIKLTLLFKFTPGNLGLVQIGMGGIFSLLGLDFSSGVFISMYQLVCLVVISFPISLLLSLFSLKYFRRK